MIITPGCGNTKVIPAADQLSSALSPPAPGQEAVCGQAGLGRVVPSPSPLSPHNNTKLL